MRKSGPRKTYESLSVRFLAAESRRSRPKGVVWHPSDILWEGSGPDHAVAARTPPQPRPFATDPILGIDMPDWFVRLSLGRLPFPELSVMIGRNIGSLRYVEADELSPELLARVREFARKLRVEEEALRSTDDWRPDTYRNPLAPQVRQTAPRRQRRRPRIVNRPPFVGTRPNVRPRDPAILRTREKPWTPLQTTYLRMRWSDGLTCKAISLEMGTTKNAILSRLYRLGLLANGAPVPYEAPSRKPVKATAHRSTAGIRAMLPPPPPRTPSPYRDLAAEAALDGPAWTREQVEALRESRSKGRTYTRIARELEFEVRDVIAKAVEIGLMTGKGRFLPTAASVPPPPRDEPIPVVPEVPPILLTPGHPLIVGSKGWTQLQELYLCVRRKAGASAWTIAKEMGRTKNSVIGKLDRMGFLRKGIKGNSGTRPEGAATPA